MSCRDESGDAINASIFGRLVAFGFGFGRAGFFLALSLKKESKKEAGVIMDQLPFSWRKLDSFSGRSGVGYEDRRYSLHDLFFLI